ncbi:cell envelope integrity protein TolA [Salmonella enterica]
MLKSLRFIPLCVLIFSVYASAADTDTSGADDFLSALKSGGIKSVSGVKKSTSDVGVVSYIEFIRDEIKNQLGDSLEMYKGMTCSLKVGLLRDGTIIYSVYYSGDADFCNTVIASVRSIKKFSPPPSEQVYQAVKDFTLQFKP